jgi:hypothetical protein
MMNQRHNYPTRSRDDFVIPITHSQIGNQNFYIRGLLLYNSLNQRIKNIFSISLFKSRIIEYFLEMYEGVDTS